MKTEKKLGIWMDHANAHLKFTHEEKEKTLHKSESMMHHKEQHQQSEYYQSLGEIIKDYDDVLLFGPTNAKVELLNMLEADSGFSKIKIETMQADKMTENQEHAFVKDYFSKRGLAL
jgi:hypothetical protein